MSCTMPQDKMRPSWRYLGLSWLPTYTAACRGPLQQTGAPSSAGAAQKKTVAVRCYLSHGPRTATSLAKDVGPRSDASGGLLYLCIQAMPCLLQHRIIHLINHALSCWRYWSATWPQNFLALQAGVFRPAREPEDFGDVLPSAAASARGSGRARRRSHFPWCGLHSSHPCKHSHVQRLQLSDELACLAVMHACMLDALVAKVCATASTNHSTLQRLHQLALHAHGLDSGPVAGVPGDFWHARGALPVVALNSVLEQFREWTQPTLMLVGNHDQVRHPSLPHCLALPVR